MARANMALRRGPNHSNDGSDDVQRSIELLDKVLSEFDDVENANQLQNIQQFTTSTSTPQLRQASNNSSSTPDDESPSLGHQSEDDGYMSMNGRKAKFNLAFKPLDEVPFHNENNSQSQHIRPEILDDFPPPPEEAERLIATLLPRVSPAHKTKSNGNINRAFPLTQLPTKIETIPPPQKFQNVGVSTNGVLDSVHIATQTTLPKTRHQRPFGWENTDFTLNPPPPPPPGYRFGSLPFQYGVYPLTSPTRVPPRTIPSALERHREVRRRGSEDNFSSDLDDTVLRPLSELADDEHFSDDSLEEMLPLPSPVNNNNNSINNKRASIAWEVLLDDEALLTPGSTKVVGRRRKKSGSHSSTNSIPNRLKDVDDWPDPPPCTTEDEITSPFSDSDDIILPPELNVTNLSGTKTYIIRRGKKDNCNNRTTVHVVAGSSSSSSNSNINLSTNLNNLKLNTNNNKETTTSHHNNNYHHHRLSDELNMPNSRYSVDLSTSSHSRLLSQELMSPKSRYSLDLNNSKHFSQDFNSSPPSRLNIDVYMKKHSTTFDNIKSLIREGGIQNFNDLPKNNNISDIVVPSIVRVVSLPSLNVEEFNNSQKRELDITVEEEEDCDDNSQGSTDISPLRKIEQNISELLERRDIEVIQNEKCLLNGVESLNKKKKASFNFKNFRNKSDDRQNFNNNNNDLHSEEYYRQLLIENGAIFSQKKNCGIQKSESAKEMLIAHREPRPLPTSTSADFPIRVEILQHELPLPPLPPSPVEEDDEYSEIINTFQKTRADTLPNNNNEPPIVPPHREACINNSLKTRSMDVNYNKNRRNNFYNSSSSYNRIMSSDRRTLPVVELQEIKRRPFHKRTAHSPQEEYHLQTSCSLPETPIFARGCDIPRTPHRRAPDIPGSQTGPRQSNTIGSLNTIGNMSTGGYKRSLPNPVLEQAIVGSELLRLTGGPGRGWYPKQRHRRPASIEHLDRVASGHNPWESNRKPLTLPPNLTPKFFQRSPRDALRRVTSLLIRKGNNGKEPRKEKEVLSPTTIHENANGGEEVQKKKGFFKNFWKRSRHYSLEQHQ